MSNKYQIFKKVIARIEGTGIKTPSKESSKKATAFLGGFQKKADESL